MRSAGAAVRLHPLRLRASAYVSIRQHTSAYVSIRQHTSACVSILHQLYDCFTDTLLILYYWNLRRGAETEAWRQQLQLYYCFTDTLLLKPAAWCRNRSVAAAASSSKSMARRTPEHTWAYVSIREHTWAFVSIRQRLSSKSMARRTPEHTSAYVSIRQHTSAFVFEEHGPQNIWAYVSIRQHTSAYVSFVSIRQRFGGSGASSVV
jgi:hypothetical protein